MRKRLKEIDNELQENEAVAAAEATLNEARENRSHWSTRKKDLELEREQLRTEADEMEAALYSGEIENPRELEEMQSKVEELKRRYADLEEPEIEAAEMLDEWEKQLAEAETVTEKVREEQAETIGALMEEKKRMRKRIEDVGEEIEKTRERIADEYLEEYDRLRRRTGGGLAVAAIRGDECTGCGMQLTSRTQQHARRGSVVNCPTCGRIVVYKPAK